MYRAIYVYLCSSPRKEKHIKTPKALCNSLKMDKHIKTERGEAKKNSREGISGNPQFQGRSYLAQKGINYEGPAGQFQRRYELAPKGINPEV